METKFNFKSQICTSVEQSRKLLELGLKKETADMKYPGTREYYGGVLTEGVSSLPIIIDTEDDEVTEWDIPAWSLGRLWELYWSNKVVSDCLFGCGKYMNPYAMMIAMIEYDIEDGTFNKDYLDE